MVPFKELKLFPLYSVHQEQDASFELSISTIKQFFNIKGEPFDLGGSEQYPKGKNWSKMVFKRVFLGPMAFVMHINGKNQPKK